MKHFILIIALCSCVIGGLNAQYYYDRSKNPDKIPAQPKKPQQVVQPSRSGYSKYFFLSWEGNKPMSNISFIDKFSASGFKLGFRKRLNEEDKLWVGFDLGEAVYNQYVPYETYNYGGTQSISTDLYNYSYNYSATVNMDYYFFPMESLVVPYLGLGIGASYIKFSEFYNVYGPATADSWGLLLRPEVGILVGFKQNSAWRLKGAVHLNYASNTYNFYNNDNFIVASKYSNFINTGLQIGIVRMIR